MDDDNYELNQLHNSNERFDVLHDFEKFLVLEGAEEVIRIHHHVNAGVDDGDVNCHVF